MRLFLLSFMGVYYHSNGERIILLFVLGILGTWKPICTYGVLVRASFRAVIRVRVLHQPRAPLVEQ